MTMIDIKCQDIGRPGCFETPDERYTMRFDDIGEPPIYFCSSCGKIAQEQQKALDEAFKNRGSAFSRQLENLITEAENEQRARRS